MTNSPFRRLASLKARLGAGGDRAPVAVELVALTFEIELALTRANGKRRARLAHLRNDVLAIQAELDEEIAAYRLQRARVQLRNVLGTGTSASTGFDNDGVGDPDGALLTAAAHLQQVATQIDRLMQDEEATPELIDMAVSVSATVEVTRAAVTALNWHGDDGADTRRRADVGYSAARLAFVASEALRAEAIAPLSPVGAPVPDVPRGLLWLIADLTVRLRTAGRIGSAGSPTDAGLAARDAADLVVTTYRRWTPRLHGARAAAMTRLAVTVAYATTWAGLSTVVLDDDDGCGCPASVLPRPPERSDAAAVELPRDAEPISRTVSAVECTLGPRTYVERRNDELDPLSDTIYADCLRS